MAAPEQIAILRARWEDLVVQIRDVQVRIREGRYAVALDTTVVNQFSNVFGLVYFMNEVVLNTVQQMIDFINNPENAAQLSDGVISELLDSDISSYTNNILAPDYLSIQADKDHPLADLQSNPEVRRNAMVTGLKFWARPQSDSAVVNSLTNQQILTLIDPINGKTALQDLKGSVYRYIEAYNSLGYVSLPQLAEITDLLSEYFACLTKAASTTMGPVANDLFNNIYSLQSGILMMVSLDLGEMIAMQDQTAGFIALDEDLSGQNDVES